jgi:Holliday junction DNA helicase RuvA subunit
MISHIEGVLKKKNSEEPSIEVDVNGIWYEIDLPVFVWRTFEGVEVGESVSLETFYYVAERQPIPKLVGFRREVERDFFKKFIEVPRVGPTTATKALVYSVSTIAWWIENGDVASIKRLPGIASRMADTIVAQLKGKVYAEAILEDEHFDSPEPKAPPPTLDAVQTEVVEGLVQLGWQRREASRVVEEIVRNQALESAEEIIRAVFALRSSELA